MKQSEALDIMKMGHNVFLTGEPGAGKTYVLNSFIKYLKKHGIAVGVTASTGIASTHIGGMTIHSWSGIGIKDDIHPEYMDVLLGKNPLQKRFNDTKVLIIDEVSMLHGKRLDLVNQVCKAFKKSEKPFGGLQVVLTGDLFQLPPVTKNRGDAPVDFVFKSDAWKELNLKICYLKEQHRQDDDRLLEILSKIRKNEAGYPELDTLQTRQVDEHENNSTRLYTHNADVDAINITRLNELNDDSVLFEAITKGKKAAVEALIKTCLAPEILELKLGAEIMCVANNPAQRFVNGSRGTVVGFDDESGAPMIKLHDSGRRITMERNTWSIQEGDRTIAELAQYPLRLAWAITIHKSQGMSLDSAEVDLGRSFEPGMGYVALSRLRTLDGLLLRGINEMALKIHPEVLDFDIELNRKSAAAQAGLGLIKQEQIDSHHETVVKKLSSTKFDFDSELMNKLKSWRADLAKDNKVPAYIIFDDKTLKLLAAKKPSDEDELSVIKGIGKKKLEEYGEEVLAIIATFEGNTQS